MTTAITITPEQRGWERDKAEYLTALEKKDIAFMTTMREKRPECIDNWTLNGLPALHYALKTKDIDFFVKILDLGANTKIYGRYSSWFLGRQYYNKRLVDMVCKMAARDFAFILLQRGEFGFDLNEAENEKDRAAFKDLYNSRHQIREEYLKLTRQDVLALPQEIPQPAPQVTPAAQSPVTPDPDKMSLEEKFNLVVIRLYETTDQLAQSQKLLARALEKLDVIDEKEQRHHLNKPAPPNGLKI
jgi:hypothetical protein